MAAAVAGRGDALGEAAEIDHPVAGHPAVEAQVAGVGQPVGDVVRRDTPGRPLDPGVQLRVPPDVVGVDRDADLGTAAEGVAPVVRLAQRAQHGAGRAEHRMQRLQRQHDPGVAHVGEQLREAVQRAPPRGIEVAVSGVQPAADRDQAARPDRGGLIDHTPVVVEPPPPIRRIAGGHHPADAVAAHRHAGVADHARGAFRANLAELLPPHRHRPDTGAGVAVHRLGQRPPVARGELVDGESVQVLHRGAPPGVRGLTFMAQLSRPDVHGPAFTA